MRIVTAQEMKSWLETGKVLEKDSRGPKVIALADGTFLKIFHTRRHFILARLFPAAKRFARNAETLKRVGVATPKIKDLLWIDKKNCVSACTYHPLPGESIEQIQKERAEQIYDLIKELASFIIFLHQSGIYFRSLHLGNILQIEKGKYGLIDFLDLSHKNRPLTAREIKRNFTHLRRYLNRRKLNEFPILELMTAYEQSASSQIEPPSQQRL